MRKSLWVIALVLVVATAAPVAHADTLYTYTFTFTGDSADVTFTTQAMAAVTAQTTILAADLASYSLSGSYWNGSTLSRVVLDYGNNPGNQAVYSTSYQDLSAGSGLTLADYSTPGSYTECNGYCTLDVTAVTTPEPPAGSLMLVGVVGLLGLITVMRKP